MRDTESAVDVKKLNVHRAAQAMARDAGFDPYDENFAKCVGAIMRVLSKLQLAEEKLAENGIIWEDDRYVFDGKG